jgi:glyoxylase I family protein
MALDIRGLTPLLQVFNMPESVGFYRDRLGFEIVGNSPPKDSSESNFNWVLLRLNGVELMLNTAYEDEDRPEAPDPARVSSHGDITLYFGCPDVEDTYRQLLAQGLAVKKPVVQRYGMKQVSLTDPDGYGLCFQWPV